MEHSNFTINGVDRTGADIKITCEGIDDQSLAHFGGLDLVLKAARQLISATHNPMSFPEKEGDYDISDKVVALLLNEVGELIRNTSIDPEHFKDTTNIELVKDFMERIHENQALFKIIEMDNNIIREANEKVQEEENEIWNDILKSK